MRVPPSGAPLGAPRPVDLSRYVGVVALLGGWRERSTIGEETGERGPADHQSAPDLQGRHFIAPDRHVEGVSPDSEGGGSVLDANRLTLWLGKCLHWRPPHAVSDGSSRPVLLA